MKFSLALLAVLALSLSASAKKFQPLTVTIKASPEAVKAAAVSQAIADGYAIESEGQFQIVFQKNMKGVGGFLTSAFLSPTGCRSFSPRWLLTVLFVPEAEGVTVTTHYEQEHADTLCRPARQSWDKDGAREISKYLELVQSKAEQMAKTSAPAAPPVSAAAETKPVPAVPATAPAPAVAPVTQTTPAPAVTPAVQTQPTPQPQELSLGEIARQQREKKKAAQDAEGQPKQ
jgi:hypothetical protein